MSAVHAIEQAVQKLAAGDLAEFRRWFFQFDEAVWDAQIESDAASGKLAALAAEARAQYQSGQSVEIRANFAAFASISDIAHWAFPPPKVFSGSGSAATLIATSCLTEPAREFFLNSASGAGPSTPIVCAPPPLLDLRPRQFNDARHALAFAFHQRRHLAG